MNARRSIAMITDFGNQDPFVGIMKAVVDRIAPGVPVIDLTHEIPPGDILRGAVTLWQAVPFFREGTIFLCVVDPGVGTQRMGLALFNQEHYFIGPDNGLFTLVAGDTTDAYELRDPRYQLKTVGSTFHGRDIFAPAAAYLANGVRIQEFGPQVLDRVNLTLPELSTPDPERIHGEILFSDRFGNILTTLGRFSRSGDVIHFDPWLPGPQGSSFSIHSSHLVTADGLRLKWARTFAEIPEGTCAAVIGSSGLIEIASNQRSAAEVLGAKPGQAVEIIINRTAC